MKIPRHLQGVCFLLASTFLYSFFGVFTRLIGFELPFFYQVIVRNVVSVIPLMAILVFAHQWKKIQKKDFIWVFLRAAIGFLSFICFYHAIFQLPMGIVYFIFYGGSTIGGYLLGTVLFHEKVTKLEIFSLFLAFVGLWCVYSVGSFDTSKLPFVALSIISGFCTAAWNTFSKKVSDTYSATQLNFLDSFLTLVFSLFFSILLQEKWVSIEFNQVWILNLLFASMFILTGQFMVYGFNRLDAQIGSLVMLSEILFAIIMAFLFFGEVVTPFGMFGGLLIVLAMALPQAPAKVFHTIRVYFTKAKHV